MISVEALELLLKIDSAVEHHDIGLMGEARYLDAKENLMDYIASLETENAALRERTRWIPVSERLPKDGTEVLIAVESVFEPHYHIWKAYHVSHIPQWTADNGLYYHHTTNYESITHWMPLPEAPKEKE